MTTAVAPNAGRVPASFPDAGYDDIANELAFQKFALDQHAIVAITDARGTITYVNDLFCKISGYSRDELVGQNHRCINSGYHPKSFFRDMYTTITRGNTWRGEICNRAKDGACYWVATTIVPFIGPDKRPQRYVSIRTDITQRKQAEAAGELTAQALRHANETMRDLCANFEAANAELALKNKRLAELYATAHEFVDNVSHEFRTPLTVIKEFTSILREGLAGPVNTEQEEYLQIIADRTDDLAVMVDDMLDISKQEAGLLSICRRYTNAATIVERHKTTLARKAKANRISIDFEVAHDLPEIYCDPEKIARVLINLTVNAIKFTRDGGHVRIGVDRDDDARLVRFSVTDDGPGIAPENLRPIFERFRLGAGTSRTAKGFGLGLHIASELVKLNDGEIGVTSTVGKGSTFWFTVPCGTPADIAARFLLRVEQSTPRDATVTHVSVRAEPQPNQASQVEISEFLQRALRRNDLLFEVAPFHWLLLVDANLNQAREQTARLQKLMEDVNRNRPEGPLPQLTFTFGDVWRTGDPIDPFVRKLNSPV